MIDSYATLKTSQFSWLIYINHIGIVSKKKLPNFTIFCLADVGLVRVWRLCFSALLSKNTENSSEEIIEWGRSFTLGDSVDC